ncbi:germ cell nuclear acidic protein-like [Onthophagus taurus]|uniref:germ cell nuclear acidic protein-like n=1 Tax=Onthophagus taurus TaxID=166361 RepID=UPI0039BDB809
MSCIDDSFELLSARSPKIDPTKKKLPKKATKLTLKTTKIRRSSILNNQVNNCTAIIVSSSSTDDSDLPSDDVKVKKNDVIVIESSDSEGYPSTPRLLDDEIRILDDLYGVGWRESQKHLFPKSELKGFRKKNQLNLSNFSKTETKKNQFLNKISNSDDESDKENHKKTKKKLFNDLNDSSDDNSDDLKVPQIKSFLESLSKSVPISKCDPSARIYRENFKGNREILIDKLKSIYNENIFGGKLKDVPIEWSEKMRSSAGFCYCKKKIYSNKSIERSARIVLSKKIIDSADRLRDTLIHEMCHAAAWIIDLVTNGHGPIWQKWTRKAVTTFPELPPIKTCHNYVIQTKYTYECMGCSYSFGRHSKSLNLERKRCGYCYGTFKILINKTNKNGETKSVPVTPSNKTTPFANFVKENYKLVKTQSLQHGDVMKLLGKQFKELKMKE